MILGSQESLQSIWAPSFYLGCPQRMRVGRGLAAGWPRLVREHRCVAPRVSFGLELFDFTILVTEIYNLEQITILVLIVCCFS